VGEGIGSEGLEETQVSLAVLDLLKNPLRDGQKNLSGDSVLARWHVCWTMEGSTPGTRWPTRPCLPSYLPSYMSKA